MKKNLLIAILGLAVVALLAVIFLRGRPSPGPEGPSEIGSTNVVNGVTNVVIETKTTIDGEVKTAVEEAPLGRSVERRPLEPEATKRLRDGPVIVSALFEASGKAEYASNGRAFRGSYLYTTTVRARSEILETNVNERTGSIRVVERRTFLQAVDALSLSEIDVAVALDTLPVGQVKGWADNLCDFFITGLGGYIPGATPLAKTVKATVGTIYTTLNAIDGVSARFMLGLFDVEIPPDLDVWINERVAQLFKNDLHAALQSIQGKSYRITYHQAANGMPLSVDFEHEDGGPITESEWEILRSANVFLDANAVPDARCRVGDAWTVFADEVQELFGAAGDGRSEGKIRMERVEDQPDGTWTLKIESSEITFHNNERTIKGKMRVKDGNGLVDAENASVKSLHATAEGNLASLNKTRHAMFFDFVKRLNGDSNLRFTLTVDPAE